jgi:predicted nucleic acid-binding protein
MIVIADTSPLNYLVLIGEADLLRRLYGQVVIPEGVLRELQNAQALRAVAEWVSRPPAWLEIVRISAPSDAGLRLLGDGEREAITLAMQHRPHVLLLMDEGHGAPDFHDAPQEHNHGKTSARPFLNAPLAGAPPVRAAER